MRDKTTEGSCQTIRSECDMYRPPGNNLMRPHKEKHIVLYYLITSVQGVEDLETLDDPKI